MYGYEDYRWRITVNFHFIILNYKEYSPINDKSEKLIFK